MDVKTTEEAMALQLAPLLDGALSKEYGWLFRVDGLLVFVTMSSRRKAEPKFLLRIGFDQFPLIAPTYGFVRPETLQINAGAAPPNVLHGSGGICCPGTREFHEALHKGDAAHPWDFKRYTVGMTLQNIHKLMERGVGR